MSPRNLTLSVDGCKVGLRARMMRGRAWWIADLRPDFREHATGVPCDAQDSVARASLAAGAILARLRGGARQGDLFAGTNSPGTVGAAVAYRLRKSWPMPVEKTPEKARGTREWATKHSRQVVADLGAVALADLLPPKGNIRLDDWTTDMRERGLSAHTIVHRHSALRAALKAAHVAGWLAVLPIFPPAALAGEAIYTPTCRPISHEHYILVRNAVDPGYELRGSLGHTASADLRARHLLYLDFVRYTGSHKHDADSLRGEHVSLMSGRWLRRNLKSAGKVEPAWVSMPPPLRAAFEAEYARRGGFIAQDELICGVWTHPTKALASAAKRLGVPAFTLLDLRSTVATELAAGGAKEHVSVCLLGHTTSRMVREVYRRVGAEELSEGMHLIGAPAAQRGLGAPSPVLRFPGTNPAESNTRRGGAEAEEPAGTDDLRRKRVAKLGGTNGRK